MNQSEYVIIGGVVSGLCYGTGYIGTLEVYTSHLPPPVFTKCIVVYLASTIGYTITGVVFDSTFLKCMGITGSMVGLGYAYTRKDDLM